MSRRRSTAASWYIIRAKRNGTYKPNRFFQNDPESQQGMIGFFMLLIVALMIYTIKLVISVHTISWVSVIAFAMFLFVFIIHSSDSKPIPCIHVVEPVDTSTLNGQ